MSKGASGVRYAEVSRETKETKVTVVLDLDGGSRRDIETGIGFFDHMLDQLAFHGEFNVGIQAEGDLIIDDHHTVEDVGLTLGTAFRRAMEASPQIARYASNHTPMDDALVLVALDFSGRAFLDFDVIFERESIGAMSTECVREFFRAFCTQAGMNLHIRKLAGHNDHHVCEAIFKGVGRALNDATASKENRSSSSTKGRVKN
ncbi:MAG: imidazoleglycerol-phosphate dehydratase HisB [Armatimonadetes bacterium]|nr:imidazoleglycerol-phosphate dehydratase HisB [Armatimonadota bacterium]